MDLIAPEIDAYAKLHASPEDALLAELTEETRAKAKYPQMQTGHVEGLFLRLLVQALEARSVLEIGCFTGYSALSMAMGLPEGGKVTTCDIDPEMTVIAKRYWARSPHGGKIELVLGPALETVAGLDGPFDLVFIDADKENYIAYWDACIPKVRSGGFVAVDNVLWSGRVLDPKEKSDYAIVAFNQHAARDDRVDKVVLTVRDGITLARKK